MTQKTIASDSDLQYLRNTGTGVVLDAEIRLGINGSTKTLLPIQKFGDAPHIAGPVTTVRFLPKRGSEKPLTSMYEIMQNSGAGSVIVVEGHGYSGHLFGGNMAHMGIQTGVEAGEFKETDSHLTILSFFFALLQYSVSRFVASSETPKEEADQRFIDNLISVYVTSLKAPAASDAAIV